MNIWINPFSFERNGETRTAVSITKKLSNDDPVPCMECGQEFKQLTTSHLATHDMTLGQYRQKHGREEYIDLGVAFGIENLEVDGKGAPVKDGDGEVQGYINAKGEAFQLTIIEDEEEQNYLDAGVVPRSTMENLINQTLTSDTHGLTFTKNPGQQSNT